MNTQEIDEIRALAEEASRFASSHLGKYLFNSAEKAAIDAQEALCYVEPDDCREIRRLQNEVKRYRDLTGWINELLTAISVAHQQSFVD